MASELPDDVYEQITALCSQGDDRVKANDHSGALTAYVSALKLLPQNHRVWKASTWIYVAIGDVHWKTGKNEKAFRCFINAVQCPEGLGNPYIHLRLGQLYFENGNLQKAADELTRAYMGAGPEIFDEDDPKYFEFLKSKIVI